ncbi:MAG: HNH endonuclease [Clostridia bacterium]|nr:HNH endonuclease [Clostridia bacterium]
MKYPQDTIDKLNAITDKRPATVIQHILKYGFITTEELKNKYGYEHAPRAARDVRERGVNLVTYGVKGSDGRNIVAYKFGDPVFVEDKLSKVGGRTALSQALKKSLVDKYGSVCFIYLQPMEKRLLQVDHRIPYEIGGEQDENNIDCFMLLSPSANRAKSWTCEHCPNWVRKDPAMCEKCIWAHPEE